MNLLAGCAVAIVDTSSADSVIHNGGVDAVKRAEKETRMGVERDDANPPLHGTCLNWV